MADYAEEGLLGSSPEKSDFDAKIDEALFNARLLVFAGEVEESQCREMVRLLEAMVIESSEKPIKVVLNSLGGSIYDGLLLFNTIRDIVRRGTTVNIEVRGVAASMAAIILQAGTNRTASKVSRFLLHESSLATDKALTVTEQAEMALESRQLNRMLNEVLAERTGKSVKQIETATGRRDFWMSAKEAKRFGLVDTVQ